MKHQMVNESLRIIRVYWRKTQSELASELGLSQSYISDIEVGKREVTLDLLGRYSKALSVPMSTLLLFAEGVDGVPPKSRGTTLLAEKTVSFLKRLIPDNAEKENGELQH